MPVPAPSLRLPAAANDAGREERVKMTRLRQTIARRLKEAQNTAAMLTTFNEVDMSARDGAAHRVQGAVREEARREARLHGLLREGLHARRCRRSPRSTPRSTAPTSSTRTTTTSASPSAPTAASSCRWCATPTACRSPRSRRQIAEFGRARPRRQALDRGHAGRHLHHLQRRRLRLADVDADPQPAAVGHPRHAQDPGAARWCATARSWPAR